jgi:hypothetical protein
MITYLRKKIMPEERYPTGIVAGTDTGKAWNVPFLIITV